MATHRRLPHFYPEDGWLFLTWCLFGSLTHGGFPPAGKASSGEAFVWMDRYLDSARLGPVYLKQDRVAGLVVDALFQGVEMGQYRLGSFVVMANHVHVLLLPAMAPSRLLKSLKGFTAREANRLLGRTGESFWQRETYDHAVRDERGFGRIVAYIENNPVKAGVVARAEDYPWSSACLKWRDRLESQVFTRL